MIFLKLLKAHWKNNKYSKIVSFLIRVIKGIKVNQLVYYY